MAKRKDSEGLFEVISRTRASQDPSAINVPEWMSKKPPEDEAGPEVEPAQEGEAEQAQPAPPLKGGWVESKRREILRPFLAICARRVTVSLSFAWCGILGLALVTLVLSTFLLGWKLGARSGTRAAGPTPYNRNVLDKKDPGDSIGRPAALQRDTGKFYMVIQGVEGMTDKHRAEAQRIVDFCNKADLPADIAEMPNQLVVWSLTGFDSADSPKAKEYAQRIKALGKQYKDKYRTFELRQTYPGGDWPWFHEYRPRR